MEALARVANVFGCGTCLNMAPVTPRSKPALATPPAAALEEKLILDLAPPNCSMDSREGNSSQRQESGGRGCCLRVATLWWLPGGLHSQVFFHRQELRGDQFGRLLFPGYAGQPATHRELRVAPVCLPSPKSGLLHHAALL